MTSELHDKASRSCSKDFLFLDSTKPNKKESRYTKLIETCKSTNSAGGCYELFLNLKRVLKDVQTVSPECYGKLSSSTEFSGAVWGSLDLLAQLSWGVAPPKSASEKAGWFDSSDLNLYCELKKTAVNVFSQSNWDEFSATYFISLPGAQSIGREEAWQKMLFSTNCAAYL